MTAAHKKQIESQTMAEFYLAVRRRTEELCEPLEVEDYIPQPIVDVSPAKWNIAHTTWFFEEMVLKRFAPDYQVFDPSFGFLFNSYYNSIGERTARDHRGDLSRPTVKRVFEYRRHVDEHMARLLTGNAGALACMSAEHENTVEQTTDRQTALASLVTLGLSHEQQHQ